jgi:hypothetical protein
MSYLRLRQVTRRAILKTYALFMALTLTKILSFLPASTPCGASNPREQYAPERHVYLLDWYLPHDQEACCATGASFARRHLPESILRPGTFSMD